MFGIWEAGIGGGGGALKGNRDRWIFGNCLFGVVSVADDVVARPVGCAVYWVDAVTLERVANLCYMEWNTKNQMPTQHLSHLRGTIRHSGNQVDRNIAAAPVSASSFPLNR
jgi:hypothetical protein